MQPNDQPLSLDRFAREHIIWLLGLLPFAIAGLRVLVWSGGYPEVLYQVLQSLNVVQLMLATLIPLIPFCLFWAYIVWRDWVYQNAEAYDIFPEWIRWPLMAILIPSVFFYWNTFSMLLSLIAVLLMYLTRKRTARQLESKFGADWRQHYRFATLRPEIVVFTLATAVVGNTAWLPTQAITVEGGSPETVYVLSANETWTITINDRKEIHTFPTPKISSINTCSTEYGWLSLPLKALTGSPNQRCPR